MMASHSPDLFASEELPPVHLSEGETDGPQPLTFAYFWLLLFFVVYCARPQDWVPGLAVVPLARIAGLFCLLSFLASISKLSQNLPRETIYLTLLVFQLWLTVPLSTVWRGGAFFTTLDFSKVLLIVLVMGAIVTSLARLRRLIFVQTASVVAIATVTLIKGASQLGRIEGAVHGIYENSNELALILVLTLPFCILFLLRTHSWWRKGFWAAAAGLLVYTTMLTGSRSGLLALLAGGVMCLREFGLRGRRFGLVVVAAGAGLMLIIFAGDTVTERFHAMFDDQPNTREARAAHASAVQRQELIWKALAVTAEHPLFGVGPGNFNSISGIWHDQHNTYTQMSSEGGAPAFILYMLLLWCALANLRAVNRLTSPDGEAALFAMALRGSLYGFAVASFFADSAYQFFPYFLVAYTSALRLIVSSKEEETVTLEEFPEEIDGGYEGRTASLAV
jgi:O-antigen ligase